MSRSRNPKYPNSGNDKFNRHRTPDPKSQFRKWTD